MTTQFDGCVIQVTRSARNSYDRVCYAWYDAKQQTDGKWIVHFHGDYALNEDRICYNAANVMYFITEHAADWAAMLRKPKD